MIFEYPYAFLIIFLYLACRFFCSTKSAALIFPKAEFFDKVKYKIPLLEFLIVVFIVFALASPIKTKIISSSKKGYDIVMVLDTSGSMGEFHKLDNAKNVILEFAKKRKNDRLGLVVFGNIAYIASPLTYDKKTFESILKRIYVGIAGGKTALYDAIFLGANLFKNSNAKNKIMIVITDGIDNQSITPLDVAIKKLKKEKIKVYTIGLGPEVDVDVLKNISLKTGGKFYYLNDFSKLRQVFKDIDSLEKSSVKSVVIQKKYYFQYPLFVAVLLFFIYLINFRRNLWNF